MSVNIAVKSKRPVNLDLRTIRLPVTAYSSILHRISGVILFVAIAALPWMLDRSLSSEYGFEQVGATLQHPLAKLILWGILSALLYHLVAGIRHLLMDAGVGESMEGGIRGAKAVLVVSVVLIVLLGVWIW